jgi:uncharacterized protein (DUF885 family)
MADTPTPAYQIADELKAYHTEHDLETALWRGDVTYLERWPDYSAAGIARRTAGLLDSAKRAEATAPTTAVERNLVEAVGFSARSEATRLEIQPQLHAVNPGEGTLASMHTFLARYPLVTADHGARYHDKLRAFPAFVDGWCGRLRTAASDGDVPIRHLVQAHIDALDTLLSSPISAGALGHQAAPRELDADAAAEWTTTTHRLLDEDVAAGLRHLRQTLADHTLPVAMPDDQPGQMHLPGGVERYVRQLWAWTSLDVTPEEVHRAGLDHVARLEREYREIAGPIVGTRDVAEIMRRLRDDPELHYRDVETLLADARAALARASAAAPEWFGILPLASCTPNATLQGSLAFYSPPTLDGTKDGEFFVNVSDPTMWGTYQQAAMTYHESVPGHHLQLALSQELPELHPLLADNLVSSYGEGWGLYVERLADEMGLYPTALDRIGMLWGDSMRSCRLVVDTGIHALGWTRDQSIEYLMTNAPVSLGQATNEVDRYIGMPGQACSYMLGRITIDRMRADATARLGERFDIRAFHDQVLATGSVPLDSLRRTIDGWVEREAPTS